MTVVTSSNYWNVVFDELQKEIEENGRAKYLLLEKKYRQVIERIEERIRFFYGKYATYNKISLKTAYRKLDKEHLETFKSLINDYIKYWDNQKVSEKDTNESLLIPILQEVEVVSNETSNTLLELLVLTGWTIHNDITKNLNIQALTQEQLNDELLKAWSADNMNLYERFNVNKAKLSTSVKATLIQSFRNEATVDEVVTEVSKLMGVSENAAKRLVLTENAHFNSHSTYLALKQAGYTYYRYICRLLPTSCEDCIALHNTVFTLESYDEGVTSPPLHPNCLCYIVGEVIK